MSNNKYDHISDEELLRDIYNTREEMYAYSYLYKGFTVLSNLPETDPVDKKFFYGEAVKYFKRQTECLEFLKKLNLIKIQRYTALSPCKLF